jgi:hypothetical protein
LAPEQSELSQNLFWRVVWLQEFIEEPPADGMQTSISAEAMIMKGAPWHPGLEYVVAPKKVCV